MLGKKTLKILPLIFLSLAVGFSPSFSIGEIAGGRNIEIRIEDILIAVFGFALVVNFLFFRKEEVKKSPLFLPILAWLGIGAVSVFSNWVLGNLEISRGFFYFLKGLEFFLFFYFFFFFIKNKYHVKWLIGVWLGIILANWLFIIFQLGNGRMMGEYGIRALCERGVFPVASFFLILFVFFFNIFLYYFLSLDISVLKKSLLSLICIMPVFGVFGAASQTAFLGFVFAVPLIMVFYFIKRQKLWNSFILLLIVIIFSVLVFSFIDRTTINAGRLGKVFSVDKAMNDFKTERLESIIVPKFNYFLERGNLFNYFLGFGKGYVHEAHNQYLRNLIETGIIGSIAFLLLTFMLLRIVFLSFFKTRDNLEMALSGGLLISTLTMLFLSLATEPFIVVKTSQLYWIFAAITLSFILINKKKNNVSH